MRLATFLMGATLLVPGCFNPPGEDELETASGGTDGSTGEESTETPTSVTEGTGTTEATETATDPTAGPTTDTTGPDPTTAPTDDSTADPTTDPTDTADDSTGEVPEPFCGDGNIDDGEECDDGVDNNGLDQSCLPDCNLNVCGDSNVGPDEACDDGEDDNILEVGACAPDCSRVIEEKVISESSLFQGGNLQPNPVAFADSQCPVGTRALFAVPGVRQASVNEPNSASDPIDWPLQPYTAYVRQDGTLIWLTDEEPLLGVRGGAPEPLNNSVTPPCTNPPCLILGPVLSGLDDDWTNLNSNTCNGWTSSSTGLDASVGTQQSTTDYLASSIVSCDLDGNGNPFIQPRFYCVEE